MAKRPNDLDCRLKRESAIDYQSVASHIGRKRRGKKDRGPGHVRGRAHPALRNRGKPPGEAVGMLRRGLRKFGVDEAGRKAIDADSVEGKGLTVLVKLIAPALDAA